MTYSNINRKMSLSIPIFVASHISKTFSKTVRILPSEKYKEKGWIVCRDNFFSNIKGHQIDYFDYNILNGQIISGHDEFVSSLSMAILQKDLEEYLKYANKKEYLRSLNAKFNAKKSYKMTCSLLVFMYYRFCVQQNKPLDLVFDTNICTPMFLDCMAKNHMFRVVVDPNKNKVFTDPKHDYVSLINTRRLSL